MGKFRIEIELQAQKDLKEQYKIGNKATINKIGKIIEELKVHPKTGTGNPEMLKGDLKGFYSRILNQKDRIIYRIVDNIVTVFVISALGHYGDK